MTVSTCAATNASRVQHKAAHSQKSELFFALQGVLRRTQVFSLAGHKLPGQLKCDIFGRMPALRILNLDGVEFGNRGIEQELPSLACLTWRYGQAARFPFALEAIKSAGVLIMRGVTCLQPLLDGLQARNRAMVLGYLRSLTANVPWS